MYHCGNSYLIVKYSDYKNRTFQQNIDKLNKQLWAIKQCSLNPEDKEKLKQKLIDHINGFNINPTTP
jgi:hypothetical protein